MTFEEEKNITEKENAEKPLLAAIPKKIKLALVLLAAALFVTGGVLMYLGSADEHEPYCCAEKGPVTLLSVSPSEESGVSLHREIVLEWSGLLAEDAAEDIVISPAVRGSWEVEGTRMVFTPQEYAAAELYTVTVPGGTVLTEDGQKVKENLCFSFETADVSRRIPAKEIFSVSGRSFRFSADETISVPVILLSDTDEISVSVYRCEDTAKYIKAFSPLFYLPSWAETSIADFRCSERSFELISESSCAVRKKDGKGHVEIGSLNDGCYLLRMTAAGVTRDVSLCVSPLSVSCCLDSGFLSLYLTENGIPVQGASVDAGGKTAEFADGFVSVPYTETVASLQKDNTPLGLAVSRGEDKTVVFLNREDLCPVCKGMIFADTSALEREGKAVFSGKITSGAGVPFSGTVSVTLRSGNGILFTENIPADQGSFTLEKDSMSLLPGDYIAVLSVNGCTVDSCPFTVEEDNSTLLMTVDSAEDTVRDGRAAVRTVKVTTLSGEPVTDAVVYADGMSETGVDEHGEAVFVKDCSVPAGLSGTVDTVTFSVRSSVGTALPVASSVTVKGPSQGENAASAEEIAFVPPEPLVKLTFDGEQGFAVSGDGSGFTRINGDASFGPAGGILLLSSPQKITVAAGETIGVDVSLEGEGSPVIAVSLCRGTVPAGKTGVTFRNENLHDAYYGIPVLTKVFYGQNAVAAGFPCSFASRECFLRVCAVCGDDVAVRYIAVDSSVPVLASENNPSFVSGEAVNLPFYVSGGKKYTYELTCGDLVLDGGCSGSFDVALPFTEVGVYHGTLSLNNKKGTVAQTDFSFEITRKLPLLCGAEQGIAGDALAVYAVPEKDEEMFASLLEISSIPGDQVFGRVVSALFDSSLSGENGGGSLYPAEYSFRGLQNGDGGFGRYAGAQSDLLLSVLAAEQKDFRCDRYALLNYIKMRLSSAEDGQTAALACWGLCCFDLDCSSAMKAVEDAAADNRTLLYLAEGYAVSGNEKKAEELYAGLCGQLVKTENGLCLGSKDDETAAADTAFLFDLAVDLNQEESTDLFGYLRGAENMQTGRYLLACGILNLLDDSGIHVLNDEKPAGGETAVSLVPRRENQPQLLNLQYLSGGVAVNSPGVMSTVDVLTGWEGEENSIYLVSVEDSDSYRVIPGENRVHRGGRTQWITGDVSAEFSMTIYDSAAVPGITVINLTKNSVAGGAEGR